MAFFQNLGQQFGALGQLPGALIRKRRAEQQARALQSQLAGVTPRAAGQTSILGGQPRPVQTSQAEDVSAQQERGVQAEVQTQAIQQALSGLQTQAEGIQTCLQGFQAGQLGEEELRGAEEKVLAAQRARQAAEALTPEEQGAEQQLANLIQSQELGLQGLRERPIAAEFKPGRAAQIERLVTAQAVPLKIRLAQLQSRRQTAIGSAKYGVEEAEELREIAKARYERRPKLEKPREKTQTERDRALKTEIIKIAGPELIASRGSDGFISPQTYLELRQQYTESLGDPTNFDDIFSPMLSPQERARLFTEKSVPATRAPSTKQTQQETTGGSKLEQLLRSL